MEPTTVVERSRGAEPLSVSGSFQLGSSSYTRKDQQSECSSFSSFGPHFVRGQRGTLIASVHFFFRSNLKENHLSEQIRLRDKLPISPLRFPFPVFHLQLLLVLVYADIVGRRSHPVSHCYTFPFVHLTSTPWHHSCANLSLTLGARLVFSWACWPGQGRI